MGQDIFLLFVPIERYLFSLRDVCEGTQVMK